MIAKISDTRAWNQMGPRSPRMQTDSSFRLRYFVGIRVTPGGRHHGRRRHFRKSPTAWEGLAVQGLAVYACLALLACRLRPARAVPVTVGWPACRRSLPHALRGYAPPGLPPWAAPAPFAAWRACACRRLCPSVPLPGCASSHSASRAASLHCPARRQTASSDSCAARAAPATAAAGPRSPGAAATTTRSSHLCHSCTMTAAAAAASAAAGRGWVLLPLLSRT